MKNVYIRPELFRFLAELRAHNERDWFQAHKDRYERDVRQPLLAFIGEFAGPLAKVSRHVVADPRPVGGSLFRIHRDTRFSRDKSPYKTHAGIHFRHAAGKDVHAPGYYLHLEPGNVFAGAGVWHPEPSALDAIRRALLAKGTAWKRAVGSPGFGKSCRLEGELLKRPPRGYDPEHPLIDDLRRKDFVALAAFREADAVAPGFPKRLESFCRTTAPMMKFLAGALGQKF